MYTLYASSEIVCTLFDLFYPQQLDGLVYTLYASSEILAMSRVEVTDTVAGISKDCHMVMDLVYESLDQLKGEVPRSVGLFQSLYQTTMEAALKEFQVRTLDWISLTANWGYLSQLAHCTAN